MAQICRNNNIMIFWLNNQTWRPITAVLLRKYLRISCLKFQFKMTMGVYWEIKWSHMNEWMENCSLCDLPEWSSSSCVDERNRVRQNDSIQSQGCEQQEMRHTESCDRGMNEIQREQWCLIREKVWGCLSAGGGNVYASATVHFKEAVTCYPAYIAFKWWLRWKCHICSIKSNHHTHASEQRSEAVTRAFCIKH